MASMIDYAGSDGKGLCDLTPYEVADAIECIGDAYIPYAKTIVNDDVSGKLVETMEIEDLLSSFEFTKTTHRARVKQEFERLKEQGSKDQQRKRSLHGITMVQQCGQCGYEVVSAETLVEIAEQDAWNQVQCKVEFCSRRFSTAITTSCAIDHSCVHFMPCKYAPM
jgi:hypothetical protein